MIKLECPFCNNPSSEKERQFFKDLYEEVGQSSSKPTPTLQRYSNIHKEFNQFLILCKLRHFLRVVRQRKDDLLGGKDAI